MTVRLGLIGAGWFGREAHLKNLLRIPGAAVAAVSSRSESSRQAAQELVGSGLRVYADWRELLDMEALDAVIIALPNSEHHAAAVAALQAGKHVLCEKPLGLTLPECDDIISAARSAGTVLQVGHEMRHQELYRRMKMLVDQGAVGDARIMWCREYRGPMRPGWRSREDLTGGLLLEKNCHHFDLFNWFLGGRPVRVAAFGGTDVLTDQELLDNAQVLVEYEGGRRAVLEVCLFAPAGGDCEVGLAGTEGRLDSWNQSLKLIHQRFDADGRREETVPEPDEACFTDASGRVDRGIRAELEHFLECCRTGRTPLNSGESARQSVAVCLAAQQSIRTGQVVEIASLPV